MSKLIRQRHLQAALQKVKAYVAKQVSLVASAAASDLEKQGLCPCTHQKSGTVHALTAAENAKNLRFAAAADFAAGDTFTLNGKAVTARTLSGESLFPGYFKKGSAVICQREGSVLTFNTGGGLGSADRQTVKAFLAAGHSVLGGTVKGSYTADATAKAYQLNAGATAYVNGQKITGTVPLAKGGWQGNAQWRQSSEAQIWEGKIFQKADDLSYHKTGVQYLGSSVPELTAANIRKGVRIGSITGSYSGGSGLQYCGIAAVTQTYDPKEPSQCTLFQGAEIFQKVREGPGFMTLRATRQVRVFIFMTGYGNTPGSSSQCELPNGWNELAAGREFSLYARVGGHGNNNYQTTCCCMAF